MAGLILVIILMVLAIAFIVANWSNDEVVGISNEETNAFLLFCFYREYGDMPVETWLWVKFMHSTREKIGLKNYDNKHILDYFNIKIHHYDAIYDKNGILIRGNRQLEALSLNDKGMSLIKKYYGREE